MIFGKHINKYYLKYAWMVLFGLAALLVVDYLNLKVPELYRMVINGMNEGVVELNGEMKTFDLEFLLVHICRPLLFVIAFIALGRVAWRYGFFGSAIFVERDIRDEMFDHAKDLSQQYYHRNKVGNLMSLFTNDLDTINECFGDGMLMFFDALILGSMAFIKMIRMDPLMTLFSMVPMVFLFIAATTVGKLMTDKWEERQEKFSPLSDFSQESFTGIAVIKAFAKEVKELHAFRKLSKENEEVNVQYTRISTLMDVMITMFVETVIGVILGYGSYLVYKGVFNAGQLIEFITYFTSIIWPILAVSFLIDMGARGKASLKRVGEFLDAPVDVKDDPSKITDPDPEIRGAIEFRDLSFSFPDSEIEQLHHVSFKIAAGEHVGLIGRTGCGKTTVVDLIARTYNVPDGTVFIDGKDVNTMPIQAVRKHIAYVPQDNFLFSERISQNIAFSLPDDKDRKAIMEAARLADVHDNIMEFEEKYDTVLGENGVTVSGGQKQRISIARALLKEADILILDDSVSAVDTKTEKSILEHLKETREGKTLILIAHRITTIEHMDKIIFLEDGKLVDAGTHHELLERCEAYREMVEMQRLEDERKEYA